MTQHPRRKFLKSTALAAACLGGGLQPEAAKCAEEVSDPDRGPDLAILNATVYTVDEQRPKAEAFAVRHGRFVAVGSTVGGIMLLEGIVKFVVSIGVIVEHDAAGRRIDRDLFDARDHAKHFADLLEQFRIALAGRDFHAHTPRHLVGDLEIHLRHRWCSSLRGGGRFAPHATGGALQRGEGKLRARFRQVRAAA